MEKVMTDHNDVVSGSLLGTVAGLATAILAAIPSPVLGLVTQVAVTLLVGAASVALNHLVKRWINKKFPDRKRRRGDSDE